MRNDNNIYKSKIWPTIRFLVDLFFPFTYHSKSLLPEQNLYFQKQDMILFIYLLNHIYIKLFIKNY
jgi:hypothetical protein